jgi:hypothetical protein
MFAGIRLIGALVAAGCALLGPTAAGAVSLLYVAYEGQVTSLYDPTGVLGPGAAEGQRYRAEYAFDLDLGARNSQPTSDRVFGGYYWSTSSPVLWTRLTVNGVTLQWDGDHAGQQVNEEGNYTSSFAETLGDDGVWTYQSHVFYGDAPYALETAFTASGPGAGAFDGIFSVCVWDPDFVCGKSLTTVYMTTDHIAVRVGSIPEPGAWALMMLGVAGVGTVLRRRRAVAFG